jgi:hypothetical protein
MSAPATSGSSASNYSTGSTEARTFRGATARRSAHSGGRQHGSAPNSRASARHALRRAHTPAHCSPATARHARRRANTGELQHGAACYRTLATPRSQALHARRSDWSTAQCASAHKCSSMRAQARALQGTSGRTVIRPQQDTCQGLGSTAHNGHEQGALGARQ